MAMYKGVEVYGEVKTHSPFGWQSQYSWMELFEIAEVVSDVISIHTEAPWKGSFKLLERARSLTEKKILAKGMFVSDKDIQRAVDIGADYVLVVDRLPKIHLDKCLIEWSTIEDLGKMATGQRAVWNSRILETGERKVDTFDKARQIFPGWLCQASNISNLDQINLAANAVLIGTNLPLLANQLA